MLDTEKIRALREARGLTQEEAAESAGFQSRQAWNNIESGRQPGLTLQTLERIADALGVRAEKLLVSERSNEMRLDVDDRLVLSNQYRILEALYPDDAHAYARARAAVENGYEMDYGSLSVHISRETMTEDECREVFEILMMFADLAYGYEQLRDKSGVEERLVRFMGFDGNTEPKHLGYTRYLFEEKDAWERVKKAMGKGVAGDGLNSHMPTLDIYRRMLSAWRPLHPKRTLDRADILRIVGERQHPDNREPTRSPPPKPPAARRSPARAPKQERPRKKG